MDYQHLINSTFNELTIRKIIPAPKDGKYKSWNTNIWAECDCSCGEKIKVPLYGVTHELIKSCGHYRKEKAAETLEKIKQASPTPPNSIFLTYNGKTLNISEWSKETGIPRSTLLYRLEHEMPIEKIFERKSDGYG